MFLAQIIGTIAFSISGSVIAYKNRLDIFGVCILGFFTAFGGGILRDIFLGINPPLIFFDYTLIFFSLSASLLVYFLYRNFNNAFERILKYLLNIIDAIGLGVFTIVAAQIVLELNKHNYFLFVFICSLTACGGGVLRDLIVRRIPIIFTCDIYALTTVIGASFFYIANMIHIDITFIYTITFIIIFSLRIIVFHFDLSLVNKKQQSLKN